MTDVNEEIELKNDLEISRIDRLKEKRQTRRLKALRDYEDHVIKFDNYCADLVALVKPVVEKLKARYEHKEMLFDFTGIGILESMANNMSADRTVSVAKVYSEESTLLELDTVPVRTKV